MTAAGRHALGRVGAEDRVDGAPSTASRCGSSRAGSAASISVPTTYCGACRRNCPRERRRDTSRRTCDGGSPAVRNAPARIDAPASGSALSRAGRDGLAVGRRQQRPAAALDARHEICSLSSRTASSPSITRAPPLPSSSCTTPTLPENGPSSTRTWAPSSTTSCRRAARDRSAAACGVTGPRRPRGPKRRGERVSSGRPPRRRRRRRRALLPARALVEGRPGKSELRACA